MVLTNAFGVAFGSCVFVDYEPGDLAWAKVKGYNWWPSLVCNDPGENNCIRTLNNKTQCHVQFLDARRSRAWVLAKLVLDFIDMIGYIGQVTQNFLSV